MSLTMVVRRLLSYARPYPWKLVLLALGILIEILWQTLLPMSLPTLVDKAILPGDRHMLLLVLGVLGAGLVVSTIAAIGRDYLYARLSATVQNDLRRGIYSHLMRLSADFYSRTKVSDVMARFTTDLQTVDAALVFSLPVALINAGMVVWCAFLLLNLEWRLGLLTIVTLPLCFIGPRLLSPRATEASYNLKVEEGRVANVVQETVSAHTVVRVFNLQKRLIEAFREQVARLFSATARFQFLSSMVTRTPNLAIVIVLLSVVGSGAWLAVQGAMTVGAFVAFYALFQSISGAVAEVSLGVPALLGASGGIKRIEELLAERPRVVDRSGARNAGRLEREMALENVDFSYTGATRTLAGTSLTIRRGWIVGLVGGSGSGKSTVLSLLNRTYDPDAGRVTLDGLDLRDLTQESLRAQIAVVPQETFLFNISLLENIRIGRPSATVDDVERAARAAEIHSIIAALPEGYDTVAGERGGRLSGGQRQRVAIARALLQDPAVLLLDEATSALDPAAEESINATIEKLRGERTIVMVTHRLAAVVNADRIYVFDSGRMVEQGTHGQLLQCNGAYRKLWDKQNGIAVTPDGEQAAITPDWLKSVPAFAPLAEGQLADLAKRFAAEHFPEGRWIIREGDPGRKYYVIARGQVEVTRLQADGLEQRVACLQTGDQFGEMALLNNAPRNASVRAVTPTLVLALDRHAFQALISATPGLRERIEDVARAQQARAAAVYAAASGNRSTHDEGL